MLRYKAAKLKRLERRRIRLFEEMDDYERRMTGQAPPKTYWFADVLEKGSDLRLKIGNVNDKIVALGGVAVCWNWHWRQKLGLDSLVRS